MTLFAALAIQAQQYAFAPVPNSPPHLGSRMLQDHLGRIWFVADNRVQCFDGTRFFSLSSLGLRALSTGTLAEDTSGSIWITSLEGLFRFDHGHIALVYPGYVRDIVALRNGAVLVTMGASGEPRGDTAILHFFRFTNSAKGWQAEQLSDWKILASSQIRRGHRGELLYPCEGGYCELPEEGVITWRAGSRLEPTFHPTALGDVRVVLRDRFGCVWLRSFSGAQYCCPSDSAFRDLPPDVASNGPSLEESPDGNILISSSYGFAIGRPGHFQIATARNGLVNGSPLVAEDGTLWLGTAKGLVRFIWPFRFEYWTEREGLNAPFTILRIGARVFANSGLGLAELSVDRSQWLALENTRALGVIRSIVPGPDGTLLVVLHHRGVAQLRYDGTVVARSGSNADPEAMHLLRDHAGEYWLAGSGISRVKIRGAQIDLVPEALPRPHSLGTDIVEEPTTGDIYACYAGGLAIRHGEAWQVVTTREGLLQNACRTLAPLPNGDAWLGYFNGNPLAFVRKTPTGHTTTNYVTGHNGGRSLRYFLGFTKPGILWRGDDPDIFVSDRARAAGNEWIELSENDGLPATSSNQQSFYSDPDGSVWWAADNTIAHFYPPEDFLNIKFGPQVFVSSYSVSYQAAQLAESVTDFRYGADLTAHIGSLQFSRRNALQIRYRMDRSDWRSVTNFEAPLGRLAWGVHTLEIQGRLFTGPWSRSAPVSFTVLKPLWLNPLFLLAWGAITLLLILAFYRRRQLQLADDARSLPDLASWRLAVLTPEAHDLVGRELASRYRVDGVIARGGFATILKGWDTELRRICAIKVFRKELDNDWIKRRFEQELSALEQIHHPKVVSIYDHGITAAGAYYLVMEFIEGRTLRELLPATGFTPQRAATYLRQTASALEALHQRQIYHRDLKPENLMIRSHSPAGEDLVLIDFSIAIVRSPDETIHGLSRAAGTIYYMAPEQVIGYADSASDIYSLAKILLEMMTGSRLSDLLPNAALDLPLRVREFLLQTQPALGPASIELVVAALSFDPAGRPRDVRAFADPIADELEAAT